MFFKLILVQLLLGMTVLSHQTTFWKHMVQQLNNFRRIRAVDLKVSNMQKIYWDDNLEVLARQKIEGMHFLQEEKSTSFWIETREKDPAKRADEFLTKLTQGGHKEDRVIESVWNSPFNLAINSDSIRIGCVEAEFSDNRTTSLVMMCVFGPIPVIFNHRLYTRGSICESCPVQTGCEDNLCDEKVKPGSPAIVDILGVRMAKKSEISIGLAFIVSIFIIICAFLVQYFS